MRDGSAVFVACEFTGSLGESDKILHKGSPGASGRNSLIYLEKEYELQAKTTVKTLKGTVVKIETPGGGGYGPPQKEA